MAPNSKNDLHNRLTKVLWLFKIGHASFNLKVLFF